MNIGQAAEETALPPKTIRYYEEIGLVRPSRDTNGYRAFSQAELHKLRFLGRARALGFGAFRVTNIFAWRDTDPRNMRAAADPVGPENDLTIQEGVAWADTVIAAWGTHGAHLDRGAQVAALLRQTRQPLYALGLTKDGHPKHPLYISYTQQPALWSPA